MIGNLQTVLTKANLEIHLTVQFLQPLRDQSQIYTFLIIIIFFKRKKYMKPNRHFEFVALHAKRVELSSGFIIRNRKSHWKQTHSVVTFCLKINPILCGNREKRLSKYHKTIISCSRSREINTLFKLFSLIDTKKKIRCGAYLFTRIHQDWKNYIFLKI